MEPRQDHNVQCGEPDRWVHSACILCSNGCGLDIAVKDERIVGVRGKLDHPVNFGHLGPKGENAWVANESPRRGKQPMIRRRKGAPLEAVSWDEALDFFQQKFDDAWNQGHENLACYNSGQLTIEEFCTRGKLWRGGLQSSCAITPWASSRCVPSRRSTRLSGWLRSAASTWGLWKRRPSGSAARSAWCPPCFRASIKPWNPHNPKHMQELAELWNIDPQGFHPEVPKDIITMLEIAERGEIEFLWVIGTNPLVSLPDQNRSRRILEQLFVVVQDPFVDAATVALADIYLPVAMWGEKTGCVTNADRTVNLLCKAVEPPGEARSDFEIFVEVSRRLGFKDRQGQPLVDFKGPRDAFEEWRRVSKGRPCDYSAMTYELLLDKGGVRWPCDEQHPEGSERLYEDLRFWTGIDECESYGADFLTGNKHTRSEYKEIDPKGKAFLRPAHWRRQPNPPSPEYPLVLSTGRVVYHFHTRTKTARSEALNRRIPNAYVEIHPEDAERMGIGLGDWAEVTSVRGRWEGPAIVADTVRPGELFIPFHFGKGHRAANQHTSYARDPVSQQPQFKSSPVQLRRLSFAEPEPWLQERWSDLQGANTQPYAAREMR